MASGIEHSTASGMLSSMTTPGADKVRENRLRAMARRQRLQLQKSRRRDPNAWDYGTYQLVNDNNWLVAGDHNNGFGWSLDDIEQWLTKGDDHDASQA